MQKRLMSPDSLSKLLAVCAIGLYALGHVLPIAIEGNREFSGWKVVRDLFWDEFPRLAKDAWTHGLDADDWLELAVVPFLPLFWLGAAGFFLMARSRPRTAGLIAALSGLCAVASLVTLWWDDSTSLASGYCVWLASMGLLLAAGLCKLMPIRNQAAT